MSAKAASNKNEAKNDTTDVEVGSNELNAVRPEPVEVATPHFLEHEREGDQEATGHEHAREARPRAE